jgi:hypothetical protein
MAIRLLLEVSERHRDDACYFANILFYRQTHLHLGRNNQQLRGLLPVRRAQGGDP